MQALPGQAAAGRAGGAVDHLWAACPKDGGGAHGAGLRGRVEGEGGELVVGQQGGGGADGGLDAGGRFDDCGDSGAGGASALEEECRRPRPLLRNLPEEDPRVAAALRSRFDMPLESRCWRIGFRKQHPPGQSRHINELELEAVVDAIRWLSRSREGAHRRVVLELDSLVDGVAVVTYGTPESAAATRAASEGTAGVRGGGRGGGGTGAASLAVGEQLQNMVLGVLGPSGVLGGPWGYGVEAACCPSERCRHAEVRGEAVPDVRVPQGQWCGLLGEETRVVRKWSRVA